MPREQKVYKRKLVAYRLITSVVRDLDRAAKSLNKTKTKVVEEAIAMYVTTLKEQGTL